MLNDLKNLKSQVTDLGRQRIDIVADGRYPNKRGTRVADVATYQNDGTDWRGGNVKASKFVERAAAQAGDWSEGMNKAAGDLLEGDPAALVDLGFRIAKDIEDMCDRVDTGRLKSSFVPKVTEK